MSKYPSLTELAAQGYPGARKIELDRQAEIRYRKQANARARSQRESAALYAYMDHVSDLIKKNDHRGVEQALLNANKYLKVK